jgi:CheY-like chemotaxis protein
MKTRGKVLVIDDDKLFGKLVSTYGIQIGHKIDAVQSINEVQNLQNLASYELLLVDYDLEDMTGIEIAEFLKEKIPHTPVVMISATNRPWQEDMGHLENVIGFASKWGGHESVIEEAFSMIKQAR